MRRVLKWIGISLGSVVALVLVAVCVVYVMSGRKLIAKHEVAEQALVVPNDSATIARGAHIFRSRPCGVCHGEDLGGNVFDDGGPFAVLAAPNLTRGRGGRTPPLTDVEWERAIRHGIRRDSTGLIIMPSEVFHNISDEDIVAMIAYLKQIPPVDREIEPAALRIVGRMLLGTGQVKTAAEMTARTPHVVSVDTTMAVDYGRYIAATSGCQGCHGPSLSGGPAFGPNGLPPSNLTPGGISHYSEEDFVRALREGQRPRGGGPINEQMPWKYYRHMTDNEIRSVWQYLKTLPAKQFGES